MHIREQSLFDCVVDLERTKLVPIGEDGSALPGALPPGMWTMDSHWAMQVSRRRILGRNAAASRMQLILRISL